MGIIGQILLIIMLAFFSMIIITIFDLSNTNIKNRKYKKPWWFILIKSKFQYISKSTKIFRIINLIVLAILVILLFFKEVIGILPYSIYETLKTTYLILLINVCVFTTIHYTYVKNTIKNKIADKGFIFKSINDSIIIPENYIRVIKEHIHNKNIEVYVERPIPSFEKCWNEYCNLIYKVNFSAYKVYGYICIIWQYYLEDLVIKYEEFFSKFDHKTQFPYQQFYLYLLDSMIRSIGILDFTEERKNLLMRISKVVKHKFDDYPLVP